MTEYGAKAARKDSKSFEAARTSSPMLEVIVPDVFFSPDVSITKMVAKNLPY